jgi:hypothetical protein
MKQRRIEQIVLNWTSLETSHLQKLIQVRKHGRAYGRIGAQRSSFVSGLNSAETTANLSMAMATVAAADQDDGSGCFGNRAGKP